MASAVSDGYLRRNNGIADRNTIEWTLLLLCIVAIPDVTDGTLQP